MANNYRLTFGLAVGHGVGVYSTALRDQLAEVAAASIQIGRWSAGTG